MQLDLEFVSTDDLIAELQKRYDSSVFVGNFNMTEENDHTHCYWEGNALECVGLCNWAISRAMANYGQSDDLTETDED